MERIESTIDLEAPVEEVFAYYANPSNVIRMTPPELHLKIVRAEVPLQQGSRVLFTMRPRMMPFEFNWMLVIKDFVENKSFSEVLEKGPFAIWRHEHRFHAHGPQRTRVTDTIIYDRPIGFAAKLAGPAFVRGMLEKTFRHRHRILQEELSNSRVQ
jgi:ligand-binding SRPBCC domain-containing protein